MTVSAFTPDTYPGNGSTTSFNFTFPILDETHIRVRSINTSTGAITTHVLNSNLTVTGTGNTSGLTNYTSGSVDITPAPTSSQVVVIDRNMPFTQTTDYVENDRFPAQTHENALDNLTMQVQQLKDDNSRTFKVTPNKTIDPILPTQTVADKYIKFNSDGDGFEAITLSTGAGLGSLVDDPSPQLGGDLDTNGYHIGSSAGQQLQLTTTDSTMTIDSGAALVITSALSMTIAPDANDVDIHAPSDVNITFGSTGSDVFALRYDTTGSNPLLDMTSTGLRLGNANARVTTILDEDNMASDSATALCTQQSIKAYVDGAASGITEIVQDTTPQLGGQLDVNGNAIGDGTRELLTFTEDASAVNHVNIENQATGSGPIISAAGDDTNVDLVISGKGTGNIILGNYEFDGDQTVGAGQDGYVLTYDNGTGLVTLEASGGGLTAATQAEMETGTSTTVAVTPGRQHFHQSAAKAWADINYSGGTPSAAASYNVSSLTDSAAGDGIVNLTTSLSSAVGATASSNNAVPTRGLYSEVTGVSTVRWVIESSSDDNVCVIVFGDI